MKSSEPMTAARSAPTNARSNSSASPERMRRNAPTRSRSIAATLTVAASVRWGGCRSGRFRLCLASERGARTRWVARARPVARRSVAGCPGSASAKRSTAATDAATTTRLTTNVNTTEPIVTGDGGDTAPPAPTWRWRWWMSLLVVTLVVAIAAAFVRLPYEMVAPGSARQVNDLLSVKGTKVYPPDGKLYYATVSVRNDVNPYEVVRAWIDPDIDLLSSKEVRGTISPERFRRLNVEAMANSKQAAEVVALRRLGIEAATGKGALVSEVARDYPAASVLRANDVIVAIDGKPVNLADDAIAIIRTHRPGDAVTLSIVRGNEPARDVETTLRAGEDEKPKLGVVIVTKDFKVDPPFTITIDSGRVVGPSAGVAYALEIIDLLTPGELTGGRAVAATGELASLSGEVGEIGGVAQKTVTVQRAGAEVFLVPRANYAEAKARAGKGLKVIPIDTIDGALRALGDLEGSNAPAYALPGPKKGA